MNPIISIIIPTHNSEDTVKSCLDSIITQSFPREQFEIIIVDDGSIDNTVSICKEFRVDQLIIIEPCFQGKARNIGAKKSNANLLAFIDSDCIASKNWIKSIVNELTEFNAVTGPIENGNIQSKVAWAEYLIEFGGWDEYRKKSKIRFIPGCNQAYIKKTFDKTDGFTEVPSSEDVLFGESLRKVGVKPMFIPSIRIVHLCRTKKDKVLNNMRKLGGYSVLARKNNKSISYSSIFISKKLIPIIFLGKILKTLNHAIKAKKFTKFIVSFPIIVIAIISFCKGSWEEMK